MQAEMQEEQECREYREVDPSELNTVEKTNLWNLKATLNLIPKPYFLSTLFADQEPVAICRLLNPPFDNYAITHFGTVFLAKPLRIWTWDKELTLLDPTSMVFPEPKYLPGEKAYTGSRQLVRLQDSSNRIRKSFFVDRLLLDRFYNVPITEKVEISYLDGDYSRPSIDNLEAYLVNKNETVPALEQDWSDVCPLH